MKSKINLFSKLLRELEVEIGTRDVSTLLLLAVKDSIENFKEKDFGDFCTQFKNLVHIISNTEPKFGVLNFYFSNLIKDFDEKVCNKDVKKKWRKLLTKKIKKILKNSKEQARNLLTYADMIDVEGKTILIHDHSHSVQDALVHFKKMGKHFRVIIAEQDFEKTQNNIERMHNAKIPFQVVPTYMLSHVHENIDMAFFGALTLKDTMVFVMGPGTHGVISDLHLDDIPIYMFINTNKFSLWKSKKRGEIFIHKHVRKHHYKPIEYERIKYSHDRVPTKLFKKIITNEGVFNSEQINELFDKRLNEYL